MTVGPNPLPRVTTGSTSWGRVLRTEDRRFDGLPACPYVPHHVDDLHRPEPLRVAYLDSGQPAPYCAAGRTPQ